MKTVILEGELGNRFGREWKLDIRTPAESIRAIAAQKKDFCRWVIDSEKDGIAYRIMLDEEDIEPGRMLGPFSNETFRIVPVIMGQGEGANVAKIIVGIILIVIGLVIAGPTGGGSLVLVEGGLSIMGSTIVIMGIALVAAGIAASMMQQAEVVGEQGENKPSYVFNGPVNTVVQGGPVPVGYGRLIVGSTMISGGMSSKDMARYNTRN